MPQLRLRMHEYVLVTVLIAGALCLLGWYTIIPFMDWVAGIAAEFDRNTPTVSRVK
jgi:hypothetical protein